MNSERVTREELQAMVQKQVDWINAETEETKTLVYVISGEVPDQVTQDIIQMLVGSIDLPDDRHKTPFWAKKWRRNR